MKIAALFVLPDGPYSGREDVDLWPESRDARLYAGPWPVVAHPPCERWGRYWGGGPSARVPRKLGDDHGCFEAALRAVRTWGGVLEHPEGSHAWRRFNLVLPPRYGGWIPADLYGGWTSCVEQGHYGHKARKATWLYAAGIPGSLLPELDWGPCDGKQRLGEGFHSAEERRRAIRTGVCQRLSKRQRTITPEPFAELLLSIARHCQKGSCMRDDDERTRRRELHEHRAERLADEALTQALDERGQAVLDEQRRLYLALKELVVEYREKKSGPAV